MSDPFFAYKYPPTELLAERLRHAHISFDANALLDVYRVSNQTKGKVFELLDFYKDRLFMTHHAMFEFYKNRFSAIHEADSLRTKMVSHVRESIDSVQSLYRRDYTSLGHDVIHSEIVDKVRLLAEQLTELELDFVPARARFQNDPDLEKLESLLIPRLEEEPSNDKMEEICRQGEQRFKKSIPPGFGDKKKGTNKYGDLIIWFGLIEYAKRKGVDVIFVSNDVKDDWVWRVSGQSVAPRPELREEFFNETGQHYWSYRLVELLKYTAQEEDSLDTSASSIGELEVLASNQSKPALWQQLQRPPGWAQKAASEDPKLTGFQGMVMRLIGLEGSPPAKTALFQAVRFLERGSLVHEVDQIIVDENVPINELRSLLAQLLDLPVERLELAYQQVYKDVEAYRIIFNSMDLGTIAQYLQATMRR